MTDEKTKIAFLEKFEDLFDSGKHSDLTVTVGNTEFSVHQNILCLRTSFFEKATQEGKFAESKDRTVTINEHSAHAVWRFLKYCYTGDYSTSSNNLALGEDDDLGSLKHPRVYALADMLDVPDLKRLAKEKLEAQLEKEFVAADFYGTVKETYATTNARDEDFRNVLVEVTKKNLTSLKESREFREVMREFGEFSAQLVMAMAGDATSKSCTTSLICPWGHSGSICHFCNSCGRSF